MTDKLAKKLSKKPLRILFLLGLIAVFTVSLGIRSVGGQAPGRPCMPQADIENLLKTDYNEIPYFTGWLVERDPTRVIVYAAPNRSSWTILVRDQYGCMNPLVGGVKWITGAELTGDPT